MKGFYLLGASISFAISLLFSGGGSTSICFGLLLLGFILVDLAVWMLIVRENGNSFSLKVLFVNGFLAKVFAILSCLSDIIGSGEGMPWLFAIEQSPLAAALGCAIPNLTIAALLFLMSVLRGPGLKLPSIISLTQIVDRRFELFLIVSAVLNVLYWITLLDFSNPLLYLIARISSALSFAPFFAGLAYRRFQSSFKVWIVVLFFQLIVSFITGTRGAAFIPIGLFLIGILCAMPTWKTKMNFSLRLALPACVALAAVGVYIGIARDIVGRTNLAEAITSGSLGARLGGTDVVREARDRGGFLHNLSRRLTSWPPIVVPCMSPEPVAFRGFEDFNEEIDALTSFRIGRSIDSGKFYFSNFCLKPYDFAVHVDKKGIMTSSVELSIFVDGFTRGGWLVGVGYCFVGFGLVILVEGVFRKFTLKCNLPLYLIIVVVLCSIRRFGNSGLLIECRLLILETLLCLAVFWLLSRFVINRSVL